MINDKGASGQRFGVKWGDSEIERFGMLEWVEIFDDLM